MDNKIWVTSDLHFCHDREFLYVPRGFSNVDAMNEAIVRNWNSVVGENDDVYVLGDLILNDDEVGIYHLRRLNGRLHVAIGNHDTSSRIKQYESCSNIVEISYAYRLRFHKFHFYLTHYPTLCGNTDDGKKLYQHVINLCGHSHSMDKFTDWNKGIIYHCELDAHNLYPITLDQVITDLKEKYNSSKFEIV